MVARDEPTEILIDETAQGERMTLPLLAAALFRRWHHWLSAALVLLARRLAWVRANGAIAVRAATLVVRDGCLPEDRQARAMVRRMGIAALLAGLAAQLAEMAVAGQSRVLVLAGAWTLGWALVRLVLFEVLVPLPWRTARLIWAVSLLPWLLAAAGPLALAALPLSAVIAWRATVAAGVERRDARRAVGVAWGAEAVVELLVLAAGTALFLVPLFGR